MGRGGEQGEVRGRQCRRGSEEHKVDRKGLVTNETTIRDGRSQDKLPLMGFGGGGLSVMNASQQGNQVLLVMVSKMMSRMERQQDYRPSQLNSGEVSIGSLDGQTERSEYAGNEV